MDLKQRDEDAIWSRLSTVVLGVSHTHRHEKRDILRTPAVTKELPNNKQRDG